MVFKKLANIFSRNKIEALRIPDNIDWDKVEIEVVDKCDAYETIDCYRLVAKYEGHELGHAEIDRLKDEIDLKSEGACYVDSSVEPPIRRCHNFWVGAYPNCESIGVEKELLTRANEFCEDKWDGKMHSSIFNVHDVRRCSYTSAERDVWTELEQEGLVEKCRDDEYRRWVFK
jgi:hypothetical protein